MNVALCKCGVDMTEHDHPLPGHVRAADEDHEFDAAGTRYQCGAPVSGFLCARPRYHDEHGVECGPLTGQKLW